MFNDDKDKKKKGQKPDKTSGTTVEKRDSVTTVEKEIKSRPEPPKKTTATEVELSEDMDQLHHSK